MVSQYTRNLILENAKKQAEADAVKVEEVKPAEKVEVTEKVAEEKETKGKKTDAEKLKKKKE